MIVLIEYQDDHRIELLAKNACDALASILDGGTGGIKYKNHGLCLNFEFIMKPLCGLHYQITDFVNFLDWPMCSDSYAFPVAHPALSPIEAYSPNSKNMWDKRTVYGRNRWALTQWCYDEIKRKYL